MDQHDQNLPTQRVEKACFLKLKFTLVPADNGYNNGYSIPLSWVTLKWLEISQHRTIKSPKQVLVSWIKVSVESIEK